MKKLFKLFIILLLLFSISCKREEITIDKNDFDFRAYLLKNNDKVPTFQFPLNSTANEVFEVIDNYTQQDCFDTFHFNYKIAGYEVQSVALEYCHESPPVADPRILFINVKENSELFIDYYGIIEHDAVKKQTLDFLNGIERDRKRFLLHYKIDKKVEKRISEKIIGYVIEAYLEFAKNLYQKENNLHISKANKEQLDEFKSKHSMRILFDSWDHFKIPPPPPPVLEPFLVE